MEELKVNVEEVTIGPGGRDVEVSRGATVDVSITVAAHANTYRSDNAFSHSTSTLECVGWHYGLEHVTIWPITSTITCIYKFR